MGGIFKHSQMGSDAAVGCTLHAPQRWSKMTEYPKPEGVPATGQHPWHKTPLGLSKRAQPQVGIGITAWRRGATSYPPSFVPCPPCAGQGHRVPGGPVRQCVGGGEGLLHVDAPPGPEEKAFVTHPARVVGFRIFAACRSVPGLHPAA